MGRNKKCDGIDIITYVLYIFTGFMSNNTLMILGVISQSDLGLAQSDSDITPRPSVYYLLLLT